MNFLAHVYLSGEEEDIIIGNFIADGIRSSQETDYSASVLKGIKLHRLIDDFTDSHPLVKQMRTVLYPNHAKYSWVLTDIYMDHYLAKEWSNWSEIPLKQYTLDFYALLHKRHAELPANIQFMLPYMEKENWLYNYQHLSGIERVLSGMSRRASFENNMANGTKDLEMNYALFKSSFEAFFPELKRVCEEFLASS